MRSLLSITTFLLLLGTAAIAAPAEKKNGKPKATPKKSAPAAAVVKSEPAPGGEVESGLELTTELNEPGKTAVSDEAQQLARLALADFAKGNLTSAKSGFERVLELAPGNLPTTINLGLIAYRQKAYAEAERLLQTVVRAQPEAGLAWLILGVIAYEQDKLDTALAALSQAVLYEPKNARAHHYLGVTVGKKGWFLGAEDEMRKALEIDPDYAEAHFNLAVFYLERNPPAVELARRHYQKSLDLGGPPDAQVAKAIGQ
jgi:tetratricopeptide (TPR) repeat protein